MQDISSIGRFYKNEGFYLEGVWLWRISGGDKTTAPLYSTSKNNMEQLNPC